MKRHHVPSRLGLPLAARIRLGLIPFLVMGASAAALAKDVGPSTAEPRKPAQKEPSANAERGAAPAAAARVEEAAKPGEAVVIDFKLLKSWEVEAPAPADAPSPDAPNPKTDTPLTPATSAPSESSGGAGEKPAAKPVVPPQTKSDPKAEPKAAPKAGAAEPKPVDSVKTATKPAAPGATSGEGKAEPGEGDKPAQAEPAAAPLPPAPAAVKALSGKRVRLSGYMIPLDLEDEKCREFVLVPVVPSCFYCTPPGLNEFVVVRMKDKKPVPFSENAVLVTGVMEVGEERVDNVVTSLFRLAGEAVLDVGQGAAPANDRS